MGCWEGSGLAWAGAVQRGQGNVAAQLAVGPALSRGRVGAAPAAPPPSSPTHTPAPHAIPQDMANPTALAMSGVMMLRHLGFNGEAEKWVAGPAV